MTEVNRAERPLSPHLTIYRIQITAVSSILTRITGNALIVAFGLGVWWLAAAATSDAAFATANAVATGWFGDLVFTLSLWAVWYHYLAGLRHLYWDAGHGLELRTAEILGWVCVIGSVLLTVATLFVI
jgi:succinate dehydrogenase / fumarate reductase cytochrome b subunit